MHRKTLSFGIVLYCLFLTIVPLLTIYHGVMAIRYGGTMWLVLLPLALLNLFLLYRLIRIQNQNTLLIIQMVHVVFLVFCAGSLLFNIKASKLEYLILLLLNILFIWYFRSSRYAKTIYKGKTKRFTRQLY